MFNLFKIKNKITARISLLFIGSLLISISFIGYFGYNNAKEAYITNSIDKSKENVNKLNSVLDAYLSSSVSDLYFLTDFYALKRFTEWNDIGEAKEVSLWTNVTNSAFESFLHSKKRYSQIRFITTDGQEKIRLNYDEKINAVDIVENNKLQNKKHSSYFDKTMNLVPGTIYVSKFNLNREFGKISFPYEPTIRYSMPMINKHGGRKGMVIINLFGSHLIDIISNFDKKVVEDSYYMLNQDGYYLYHQDKKKRFGFDLGSNEQFKDEYPLSYKMMSKQPSGTIVENGDVISFKHLHPSGNINDNYLIVINKISQAHAQEKLANFELLFIILSIVIFIGIIFLIRKLYLMLSPLQYISMQLKDLAIGKIPTNRITHDANDEVSTIVNSTNILIDSISSTIKHANSIAEGDFSKDTVIHSEDDQLNKAINAMTQRLRAIAKVSDLIAHGESAEMLEQNSQRDQLAKSLNGMIIYLSEINDISKAISIGDYTRDFKLRGENDELGFSINLMISNLRDILKQTAKIADGDFHTTINLRSDKDQLSTALIKMTTVLEKNKNTTDKENFIKDGISKLNRALSGDIASDMIARESITLLCRYLNVASGVIYYYNEDSKLLSIQASFAFTKRNTLNNKIHLGDGVVGQVALEKQAILLETKEQEYIIESGLDSKVPKSTYTFALVHEKKLVGVIEVASLELFSESQIELMNQASNVIATFVVSSEQNEQIKDLLDKAQRDYEEMQLKSEELQQTNVQMEEQAQQLKIQAEDMNSQNVILTKAKQDLDIQAEDLIQASKYKSEFLANMSHELRTPLNSIILLSKMLKDALDDKKQSKKAEVINNAGNDLLLLINDILDLSKIEAGQMELNISTTSSSKISNNLSDLFSPIANEKKLSFIIKDELKSSFDTDSTKVIQILKNLLSNAFKFTKQGSVTLHIYDGNNKVNFAVIDTGIGIPKDKVEHVFEAFKQVDGSISREYGGTGLGLSISQSFTKLLNATLSLNSEYGKGSSFVLSIPKVNEHITKTQVITEPEIITNEDMQSEEEITSVKYSFDGETILLVDDDSRNIFTLSSLFREAGANTLHALNGLEALEVLKENANIVDLILMDIMMPRMDGYETIKQIRKDKKYDNSPIIAVTAKAMEEDKEKCLNAGANDYVTKPINQDVLMQLSRLWIDKMK